MLSLRFVDPDGLESEINGFNPAFDATTMRADDQVVDPNWIQRAERALHPETHRDPS